VAVGLLGVAGCSSSDDTTYREAAAAALEAALSEARTAELVGGLWLEGRSTHAATAVVVVGSESSSNSNRLREVAELIGSRAYLVDHAEQIDDAWLSGANRVGVTAGASAPEVLVERLIGRLQECGARDVILTEGTEENILFPIPKELSQ